MKKTFLIALSLFIFVSCENKKTPASEEDNKTEITSRSATKIWETDTVFKTPESVYYDESRDVLYVANIGNVPPTEKDGDGYISKLSTSGELIELKWVTGLDAAKGMGMVGNSLFVTNIDEIVEIDVKEGSVIKRFPVDSAVFLNDITVSEDSTIFISDSGTNKIHTLKNGKVNVWLKSDKTGNPNGLLHQGNKIMLATFGTNEYLSIDINSKALTLLADSLQGGDGVVAYDNDYIVSGWNGVVYFITASGEKTTLIDTRAERKNAADIEIIKGNNLILVPTFFGNTVAAYEIK